MAKFLEAQGQTEDALRVATDPDYRFELAVQLGNLEIAQEIAGSAQSESKWKQLGDLALSAGKVRPPLPHHLPNPSSTGCRAQFDHC